MGRQLTGRMTYAEYLVAEPAAEVRHEYLNGEVRTIRGSPPEHSALAAAVTGELGLALRGKRCRVYSCNARVRVMATGLSTYPDAAVVCGRLETAPDDPDAMVNPVLVVEVLSDTTEAYDRGAKAAHYRRIPSLKEYMLVSQGEPLIEVFRRGEGGPWELREARSGEAIELASVGVSLQVSAIYANPLER